MRLTGDGRGVEPRAAQPRLARATSLVLIAAALLAIVALDHSTGAAPVQHLYYLPIVFAAVALGPWAGPTVAVAAILLYHLANPALLRAGYREPDVIQIALFLAVGVVGAKVVRDARRLARLAITDDLTGLYNLRGFEPQLTAMVGASRRVGIPVSLLVLDIDRLKSLNDAHGHRAGADAVRLVGRVLAGCLRDGAIACRFGGDEFVIALPGCGAAEAAEAADELRRAVNASSPVLSGVSFPAATLSVSIGLACLAHDDGPASRTWPADDVEAGDELFRAADRALYAAKDSGRNRVSVSSRFIAQQASGTEGLGAT
jgi:diguanylate cyclase (GGDEF)-like protein